MKCGLKHTRCNQSRASSVASGALEIEHLNTLTVDGDVSLYVTNMAKARELSKNFRKEIIALHKQEKGTKREQRH